MAELKIVRFEAEDKTTLQAALPAFFWLDEQGEQQFGSVAQAVDGSRMDIHFLPRQVLEEAVMTANAEGVPVLVEAAVYASTVQAEILCSATQAELYAEHALRVTQ